MDPNVYDYLVVPCTKKLGMQSELHRNNVYQSIEILLLVPMLFLLAISKCLLIFEEYFYLMYFYFTSEATFKRCTG